MTPNIFKTYDQKMLEKLHENIRFLKYIKCDYLPLTPEQVHRNKVLHKWYERRIARVRRVMTAYHISGSKLCDCDY